MIIHNLNASNNSHRSLIMAQAQTIMNFFTEAVEQNDCNVKMVIGFREEIQDTVNAIEDLDRAFNQPIYNPDYWKSLKFQDWQIPEVNPDESTRVRPDLINDPEVVAEVKQALKDRCFNCKFDVPTFNFDYDVDFLYNRLQIQLDVYNVTFKSKMHFSLCKASFLFQRACIPDLVRLIGMFLSAYAAILALRKLPKISLGLFVKAIIGELMAKVVASVKLSIDMSSTGIPCLITAIKDIAETIPTNEAMKKRLTKEQYDMINRNQDPKYWYTRTNLWRKNYVPVSEFTKSMNAFVEEGAISREEADRKIDDYKKKNDTINYYADKLHDDYTFVQNQIDEGLAMITGVVDGAVADINAYIDSILGIINFLQCENKRTGTDFSEIIEYSNKIQMVLNLISAISVYIAKQILRWKLCKDAKTNDQLTEAVTKAPTPDLTTPDALRDIIQEYTGQSVKLDSDGLNLLIYEEPAPQVLPKLTLTGCNFKEFAEAHTLDNIIKEAAKSIEDEDSTRVRPPVADPDLGLDEETSPLLNPDIVDVSNRNAPTNNYEWIKVDPYTPKPNDHLEQFRNPSNRTIRNVEKGSPGNTGGSNPNTPTDAPLEPNTSVIPHDYPTIDLDALDINTETPIGVRGKGQKVATPPEIELAVTDVINIAPETANGGAVYREWVQHIDELMDMIYNAPMNTRGFGVTRDPASNAELNEDDPFEEISFFREERNSQQGKFQPSLDECRDFDDVMNLLNKLKL